MKIFAVLIGLLIVAALATLLLPRLAPSHEEGRSSPRAASNVVEAPQPERALRAPLSKEEEIREELAQKRLPYYRFLRQNYGGAIEKFAVTESLDTLDLYLSHDDDETLQALVQNAIAPTAHQYGFRRVHFYIPHPSSAVEPFLRVAESTYDGSGRWNTFRK